MLIYTCPKCGADLETTVLTCIPPIHKYRCNSCGWTKEDKEDVIRIPYIEPVPAVLTTPTYTNDICSQCPNKPVDGNIGVCHCMLGSNVMC